VETGTESGRRSGFCFGIHPEHAPTAAPFVNLPSVEMMHLQTLAVGYPKASKPTPEHWHGLPEFADRIHPPDLVAK